MLYHNGVTIVCDKVDSDSPGEITIEGYVVVNGCQSLTVLWENRDRLTGDLRILSRLIQLDRNSPLMDAITHNSNNQNGIKPRDFQSNNPIQLRLRNEFATTFSGDISYEISRGERSTSAEVIDNEQAARVLLAFDLRQPWTCHQTYKLFDELHGEIFARPEVTAHRIVSRMDAFRVCSERVQDLTNELMAKYTLTKYFLLDLLAEALATDETGRSFIVDPEPFVSTPERRRKVREALAQVLSELLVDLNAEVDARTEDEGYFDFKRALKSPVAVRKLSREILSSYQKVVGRGRTQSFSQIWEDQQQAHSDAEGRPNID